VGELWSHALEDLSYDLVIGPLKDPVRVTEKVASTQLDFLAVNGQLQTERAENKHMYPSASQPFSEIPVRGGSSKTEQS